MTTSRTNKKAKTKATRRTHRPRRHMFALEPRFLFDGAAAATVEQQQQDTAAAPDVQDTSQQADTQSVAADQQVQPGTAEVSKSSLTDAVAPTPDAAPAPKPSTSGGEILFIDPKVYDYQQLVDLARPGVEVVVLDPLRDGLQQITETLAGRTDVSAIHIVSHGQAGKLYLGASDLTLETMGSRAGELTAWSTSLADGADILLYGCDIAAGDSGRAFVDALAAATRADVTASTDTTGIAAYGGDWNLEYATGAIEASIGLTAEVQDQWFAVLQTSTFQEGVGGYSSTQDTELDGGSPGTNYGSATTLVTDANQGPHQVVVRFDNIFGAGAGQIPTGAIIDSADLVVRVTNVGSGRTPTVSLNRVLVTWDESSTWNSLTGGLSSGTEYVATADSSITNPASGSFQTFTGLASTVQLWLDGGATNFGWVLIDSSTANVNFASSENGTAAWHPQLQAGHHQRRRRGHRHCERRREPDRGHRRQRHRSGRRRQPHLLDLRGQRCRALLDRARHRRAQLQRRARL